MYAHLCIEAAILDFSKCSRVLQWHHVDSEQVGLQDMETKKQTIVWTIVLGFVLEHWTIPLMKMLPFKVPVGTSAPFIA